MRHPLVLTVLVSFAGCAGGAPSAPSVASAAPEPTEAPGSAPAVISRDEAAAAPAEERPSADHPAPEDARGPAAVTWAVSAVSNQGAWSMVALGDGVALVTHAHTPQDGYDPMEMLQLVEARDARGALRWRVLAPEPVTELGASADGAHLLVLGARETRVLSAIDGHEERTLPAGALLGVVDDVGRVVAGLADGTVQVFSAHGTLARTIAVPGSAPTTIHAMMADGECQEIFSESPARATSLASRGGTLAIGASDGTIRVHDLASTADTERRLTRRDLRQRPGWAIEPVSLTLRAGDELVAVYSDGSIVRWNARTGARLATVPGACTPEELGRIAVIPGLPADVEACGGTRDAVLDGDRVVLVGSGGARVRTLSGRAVAGFPTLHDNGLAIVGEELWLAGTDSVIERWSLQGAFRGVHRLGTGWANVVALSRGHVAVMGAGEGEVHGTESNETRVTRLWQIERGALVPGFDDVRGAVRFVGDRLAVVTLAGGAVAVRELAGARELARVRPFVQADVGLPAVAVAIVPADENTLIVGERAHLVTPEGVRELGRAPPLPSAGVVTGQHASRDGARLARLVFEPTTFTFALEVHALEGESPRLLFRRERVGEHVAMHADGAQVIVSSRGANAALLDARGAPLPMPEVDASWAGFDASGRPCVQSRALDAQLSCLEEGTFVAAGPRLLSPTAMLAVEGRSVALALGSGAYVLGPDGATLAHVVGVGGDGFAITTPDALLAASAGPHDDELYRREGAYTRPVPPSADGIARWRALLAP